jgi:hypothetical protein
MHHAVSTLLREIYRSLPGPFKEVVWWFLGWPLIVLGALSLVIAFFLFISLVCQRKQRLSRTAEFQKSNTKQERACIDNVSDTEPEAAFFHMLRQAAAPDEGIVEGIVGWAASGALLVLIGSCVIYFT